MFVTRRAQREFKFQKLLRGAPPRAFAALDDDDDDVMVFNEFATPSHSAPPRQRVLA